jgi:hypothetical protein
MHKSGIREMKGYPGFIPIDVAVLGQPYIAAHLYVVHWMGKQHIANKLDVSKDTVSVYISDIASGRR